MPLVQSPLTARIEEEVVVTVHEGIPGLAAAVACSAVVKPARVPR
jgi:hypothetical protein